MKSLTINHSKTITKNVSFCDIDVTGAMWHGNYAKYFEEARCALLEKIGIPYEVILSKEYEIPIISMKIKYISPCRYNQKLDIEASLSRSEHLLIVNHEMRDFYTKKILSKAETRHMAFCLKTKKGTLTLPDFILEKIFI